MIPKITNPSDINQPVMGTIDHHQTDNSTQFYDKYDYKLTPKKLAIRVIVISLISFAIIALLYCIFFVLDFGIVPVKSISVGEINLSSKDILSIQIKSNDYQISDYNEVEIKNGDNNIIYITVKQPIIPKKISQNQIKASNSYADYELDVRECSAVYYVGDNINDKLLIWERHGD